jgi:hypothetical protein
MHPQASDRQEGAPTRHVFFSVLGSLKALCSVQGILQSLASVSFGFLVVLDGRMQQAED